MLTSNRALYWISLSSLALSSCRAFAPAINQPTTTTTTTTTSSTVAMAASSSDPFLADRKTFLQTAALSFGSATAMFTSLPAHADVTNKVASSAALRNVKLVQKRLASLADTVAQDEYQELKDALRVAPFSDLRKNMTVLVRGGEDGPDAQVLQDKYKTFIAQLEKMDTTATLALRGKKLNEGDFSSTYQATVDALADFVETAQGAAEIPVQYSSAESS